MSLCNLNEILPEAVAKGYGVLATVLFNFDFADAVVRAAEEKKSPVILMFSEPLLEKYGYKEFDKLINPVRILVQEARVPVVLHLDHGKNLKNIIHFMKSGLTSVMISQTFSSFEEDIKVAREVTEIAHSMDITVEGEVGKMPGEGGLESSMKNKSSIEQIREGFTRVEEAARFVEETNVDVLSISVGTVHGFFDRKPELDFDLIRKIKDAVKIPLVIHGASGLENEQYKGAIRNGVVKFNYLTGLIEEAKDKVRKILENSDDFSYIDLHFEVSRAFIEKVKSLIDTLRDV